MEAIVIIIFQIFSATYSNELEYLNISFKNSLPSKTFRAYVVFWYCFIDQQVYLSFCPRTKANRSPILTLILIVNKTRLEVFEIGEYHLGYIIGYSPVLAGVYSVTWGV